MIGIQGRLLNSQHKMNMRRCTCKVWTGKMNNKGGPECTCKSGYSLSTDGVSCIIASIIQRQTCRDGYGLNGAGCNGKDHL